MKKNATFTIEEKIYDDFDLITTWKKESKSKLIESFIRDYVIKNKAEFNEFILNKK